jgi:hypothetical protein
MSMAVILFSNALLFNLLLINSPLRIWKQIFMAIAYLLFFAKFSSLTQGYGIRFYKPIAICAYIAIPMAFALGMATLLTGTTAFNAFYAILMYIGLVPFLLFPLLFIYDGCERKFFRLFGILAWVLGIGLLVDHFTGIFNIFQIGETGTIWMASKSEKYMRASFLFETPTAIVYFSMFCILSLLYLGKSSDSIVTKFFWYSGLFFLISGLMFTGSRQVWFLAGLLLFVGIGGQILYQQSMRSFIKYMCIVPIIMLIFWVGLKTVLSKSERGEDILLRITTAGEKGTDFSRIDLWKQGIRDDFYPDNIPYWLFGHGLGITMGQHAVDRETVHTHYESTFLFTFYEGGLTAWFIFYWPSVASMIILMRARRCFLRFLLRSYILLYWLASMVAPGAHHYTAQICIYSILSVSATIEYFDSDAASPEEEYYYNEEGELIEC